jgi:hypothetical protein
MRRTAEPRTPPFFLTVNSAGDLAADRIFLMVQLALLTARDMAVLARRESLLLQAHRMDLAMENMRPPGRDQTGAKLAADAKVLTRQTGVHLGATGWLACRGASALAAPEPTRHDRTQHAVSIIALRTDAQNDSGFRRNRASAFISKRRSPPSHLLKND